MTDDERISDPTPGTKPDQAGGAPTKRRVTVAGQTVEVDEKDVDELLRKGIRFTQNSQALSEERKRHMTAVQPIIDLNEKIKGDPRKEAFVQAVLTDQPLDHFFAAPDDDEETDPIVKQLKANNRQLEAGMRTLQAEIRGIQQEVRGVTGEARFTREESEVRRQNKWANDDDIQEAKDYAKEFGLTLPASFRITAFEKAQDVARRGTMDQFGIDEAAFNGRSDAPVLEGIGSLGDEATMEKLYENPELYHQYRDQIRSWRRRQRGGVNPAPGRR